MPCPLVQPPAQREPRPIKMPPIRATTNLGRGAEPKACAHPCRHPLWTETTREQGREQGADHNAQDKHPAPIYDRSEFLEIGFFVDLVPAEQALDHAAGRAKGVEQPIVLSESRKESHIKIPIPIPTAYGDQRTAYNHSIRSSSSGTCTNAPILAARRYSPRPGALAPSSLVVATFAATALPKAMKKTSLASTSYPFDDRGLAPLS